VPATDEHGNVVYRDGGPVLIPSQKALNMDAGLDWTQLIPQKENALMNAIKTAARAGTIDLADYFFDGSGFNWKNVDLTEAEWKTPRPGEQHLDLTANADPPDEPDRVQFWITYNNIELVFEVGVTDSVQWCPMNGANFEYGDSSTILPRDGTTLLQLLGLTDYPDVQDILPFWERLLWFINLHFEK